MRWDISTHFLFKLSFIALLCLFTASAAEGRSRRRKTLFHLPPPGSLAEKKPVTDVNGTTIPDYDTIYYFNQLIDHSNPKLGTFKQRYFHTWEYYQPGGPIVLMTPGESAADGAVGYLTNATIVGTLAELYGGATVLLEHRFFGSSYPYPSLAVKNLQVHTIAQAVQDLVYFAQNVNLTMPGGDTEAVRPHKIPWILVGGSYAGALTAWTLNKEPGIFWAGWSSSGVVQPLADFWQYFEPIRTNMPQNCSADVEKVITFVDSVIDSGNATAIDELKTTFGLQDLTDAASFADALQVPISDWQNLDAYTIGTSKFYEFCDSLEVDPVTSTAATAAGRGLDVALAAWGSYYTGGFLSSFCGGIDVVNCLNLQSVTYSNTTIGNDDRSWWWMVCNEVGWMQDGPPTGVSAIVSRHLTVANYEKVCTTSFPGAFPSGSTLASRVNATTKTFLGWNTTADRLFVVNGKRDPWREVTLSAEAASIASTDLRPIHLGDGFHCSDTLVANAVYDSSIGDIYLAANKTFTTWLSEFKPGNAPNTTTTFTPTTSNSTNNAPRKKADHLISLSLTLSGALASFLL